MTGDKHLRELVNAAVVLALAVGCGGSSGGQAGGPSPSVMTPSVTTAPGAMFSARQVTGVGTVLVDGRGRTVYLLTNGDHRNVPCTDSTGCTKTWPDLPLPNGASAATAGSGLRSSLLGTMKGSDGESYTTYNGWFMYEYIGDGGSGQANGQGIRSFGGSWYAITPAGNPVMSGGNATMSSTTGGGYG
jgi:predicted lipoprotein with Yx(FWY)xxD motif